MRTVGRKTLTQEARQISGGARYASTDKGCRTYAAVARRADAVSRGPRYRQEDADIMKLVEDSDAFLSVFLL